MKWFKSFLLLLLFLPSRTLFTRCSYAWYWRRDHSQYHLLAKQMILQEAPELLTTIPRDNKNYKPDYAEISEEARLEFWGMFLSAISWMESSHRKEHCYEERGITDSTGENVISRGLLQFSFESARGYLPSLETPEQLHIPEVTLRIGAIALKRFIIGDQVISQGSKGNWRGAARYWSVLRRNEKHPQIQKWLVEGDYCDPRNNLIPPPPHVTKDDYEPWIMRFFNKLKSPADAQPTEN